MKKIKIAYEKWTPEDIEIGDTDDRDWIDEEGVDMTPDEDEDISIVDNAVKFLSDEGAYEPSSSDWDSRVWYTNPKYDEDYSNGAIESRSYFLDGFTDEESKEIYNKITKNIIGESIKKSNKITLVEDACRFFDTDEDLIEESETYSNSLLESANNIATFLEDEETNRIFLVFLKGDFKTPFTIEYNDIQSANKDLKSYHVDSKAKVIEAKNPQDAIESWKKDS